MKLNNGEQIENRAERRGSARGHSSSSVSGEILTSRFLGSDFHMPALCNQTNICGSPPALQSPSWEPAEECCCIPVSPPAPITLQFTLALWNHIPQRNLWCNLGCPPPRVMLLTSPPTDHLCDLLSLCSRKAELGAARIWGMRCRVWTLG